VVLSVPAIGIGAMTGPAIAGLLSRSGDLQPLLIFSAGTLIVSATLLAYAASKSRRDTIAQASVELKQ
jgi:hypothetical protein